jgi:hypothetical protein
MLFLNHIIYDQSPGRIHPQPLELADGADVSAHKRGRKKADADNHSDDGTATESSDQDGEVNDADDSDFEADSESDSEQESGSSDDNSSEREESDEQSSESPHTEVTAKPSSKPGRKTKL